MKKSFGIIAGLAALAFIAMPGTPAGAEPVYSEDGTVATVKTYEDFSTAVANANVSTIKLDDNIVVPEKVNITHSMTIDGNNKTIDIKREAEWASRYLQVYSQSDPIEVTMRNITFTGGDLSVLVHGGTLNLEGAINLSGNYGGIGISQGKNVVAVPAVNFADGVKVTYADEGHETPKGAPAPAIYSEADSFELKFDGINAAVYNVAESQDFLYFDASKAPEVSADGAFTALDVDDYRATPIADTEKPTDPETPDVTEPVDEGKDTEADVTAPNTGVTIANIALVVTGAVVAILTAVYATRFASAKK